MKMKDYERVYLENSDKTDEEIAKELGRPLATVKKWRKTVPRIVPVPQVVEKVVYKDKTDPDAYKQRGKSDHLFARVSQRIRGKKTNVGVVMTEAASQAGDDFNKNNNTPNNKFKDSIFKIFED